MTFANLEQRMAQSYIDMLPAFVPDKNAGVSAVEQERFYALIKNLYQLAFDEPLLFVASLNGDDAFPDRFNASSYGKPKLKEAMKKFIKAMDNLLRNMFLVGQGVEVKWNKRQLTVLSKLGICDFCNLPAAWVWMATRPDALLVEFQYCLFDRDYPYTSDIYARLLGAEPFRRLEDWMTARGYRRFDIHDVIASDCKLSLTYANPAWGKERPRGGFEYKIKHTGISARYDYYTQQPAVLGLCIPGGMKPYMTAFESANKNVQRFIVEKTQRCRWCGYCVQTDKTGTRPLAAIKIEHGGEAYNFCPYFPGCSYCWTSVSDELVGQLIEMMDFMDGFVDAE